MDETLPIKLPRLSDEAIALFFSGAGYASPAIDLRPFVTLQRDFRPAVIRAAQAWGLPPDQIEVECEV